MVYFLLIGKRFYICIFMLSFVVYMNILEVKEFFGNVCGIMFDL